ncbi:MAG: hypothetical protein RLZZ124_1098, partial [Cyanobacteriota bacterium]
MAQNYSQAYGFNFYVVPLLKGAIDFSELDNGLSGFIDTSAVLSNTAAVVKTGSGSTLKIAHGIAKTVTKAAVASNVATLTFVAAHGISQGATITVTGLPTAFAALNGVRTVTAVTTTSPFTLSFALTTGNIAEATVSTGKVLA